MSEQNIIPEKEQPTNLSNVTELKRVKVTNDEQEITYQDEKICVLRHIKFGITVIEKLTPQHLY